MFLPKTIPAIFGHAPSPSKILRHPSIVRWQANPLRLRRTVRTRIPAFGQTLWMGTVRQSSSTISTPPSLSYSDAAAISVWMVRLLLPAFRLPTPRQRQCLLVGLLTNYKETLLIFVKAIQSRSILIANHHHCPVPHNITLRRII